jgi:hypothetical protein
VASRATTSGAEAVVGFLHHCAFRACGGPRVVAVKALILKTLIRGLFNLNFFDFHI